MIRRILCVISCLALATGAFAQAKLQTKKYKFSDFKEKTTKVVLLGNDMVDAIFKDGVKSSWSISPYEFCDVETFNRDMTDASSYFLLATDSRFRKETDAGIMTIGLYKGNPKAASGMDGLDKVTCIPFCSTGFPDGSESIFLPILLRCIQNNVEAIMKNEFNIGSMARVRSGKKDWSLNVYIDSCKLAFTPGPEETEGYRKMGVILCDSDEVEKVAIGEGDVALAGYSVAPLEPENGSKCFNMLFNPTNGEIYWMETRKLAAGQTTGFTKENLDSIASHKK